MRVETYGLQNPEFFTSLEPIDADMLPVPCVVSLMIDASKKAGVGPMAAVAGAIVEAAGRKFVGRCRELILENGGDLLFYSDSGGRLGILAGESPFSGRIVVKIQPGFWGISTSSGSFGHSMSFGMADAVTVVSHSPSLSDAFATSLCNRIKSLDDMGRILAEAERGMYSGINGLIVIFGDRLGVWGDLEIDVE